jgi:hypothetical protein
VEAKTCTNGPRHTWTWINNCTKAHIGRNSASFTLRGRYRCACGAIKFGRPNHNSPDLRGVIGGGAFVSGAITKTKPQTPKDQEE